MATHNGVPGTKCKERAITSWLKWWRSACWIIQMVIYRFWGRGHLTFWVRLMWLHEAFPSPQSISSNVLLCRPLHFLKNMVVVFLWLHIWMYIFVCTHDLRLYVPVYRAASTSNIISELPDLSLNLGMSVFRSLGLFDPRSGEFRATWEGRPVPILVHQLSLACCRHYYKPSTELTVKNKEYWPALQSKRCLKDEEWRVSGKYSVNSRGFSFKHLASTNNNNSTLDWN